MMTCKHRSETACNAVSSWARSWAPVMAPVMDCQWVFVTELRLVESWVQRWGLMMVVQKAAT
jgi:hypothetical protein